MEAGLWQRVEEVEIPGEIGGRGNGGPVVTDRVGPTYKEVVKDRERNRERCIGWSD